MSDMSECRHLNYTMTEPRPVGRFVASGTLCADCGLETAVNTEEYQLITKRCQQCGNEFGGADNIPDESCSDCLIAAQIDGQEKHTALSP